jgi:hypothetical protein
MWFMPDITPSSGDYVRAYRSPWGAPFIQSAPESTSQTYKVGAVLQNLDGRLQIASVSGSTVSSTSIVGIAAEPASSVAGTKRIFFSANPNQEFTARTRNGTLQSTTVFTQAGLVYDSTKEIFLVDLAANSTGLLVVITENIDSTGSSGGQVAFRFGAPATRFNF